MRIIPISRQKSSRQPKQNVPWPGWLEIADVLEEHPDLPEDEYRSLPPARQAAILDPAERQWVHVQPWLQSKGYMLRPRFRPGWKPSWSEGASLYDLSKREDTVRHHVRSFDPFILR